jgi:alanine dehydrogenase
VSPGQGRGLDRIACGVASFASSNATEPEGKTAMSESWRNRKTLILSRTDMMGLLSPAEYVDCVERAFLRHGEKRYYMEPKGHIVLDKYPGEWEVMPSYIEAPLGGVPEAAACKWVSIRERNRARFDLPTVFSILVYTHPETGFPLAICDGSYHTMLRTGASAAVSVRHLARKGSKVLALVGAGDVGIGSLRTCLAVKDWQEVRVWSRSLKTLDEFLASEQPRYPALNMTASTNAEEVVAGADVVVCQTIGAGPVVRDEWVKPGMHIAALGADLAGKQEIESAICKRARIFVDDIRQCVPDGEINVPIKEGVIKESDIAGEIGEVICGKKKGRLSDDDITLFDSTGIAIQDSATVPLEYARALEAGVGIEKKMIST